MEIHNIAQETVTKTIPKGKKYKEAKWLSGKAFQIAEGKRGRGHREVRGCREVRG